MPRPPPTSTMRISIDRSRRVLTSAAMRATASASGAALVSCEPMWMSAPTTSTPLRLAGAGARERAEHAEIPVGLDRVADDVRDLGEGVVVAPVALQQGRLRVDIGGRADVGGEGAQRHLLAAEVGVAVGDVSHVTFVRSIHAG